MARLSPSLGLGVVTTLILSRISARLLSYSSLFVCNFSFFFSSARISASRSSIDFPGALLVLLFFGDAENCFNTKPVSHLSVVLSLLYSTGAPSGIHPPGWNPKELRNCCKAFLHVSGVGFGFELIAPKCALYFSVAVSKSIQLGYMAVTHFL